MQTPPVFCSFGWVLSGFVETHGCVRTDVFILFDVDTSDHFQTVWVNCSGSRFQPPHAAASTLAPSKQLCITQLFADYTKWRLPRLAALATDLLTNASLEEKRLRCGGTRRLSTCRGFDSARRSRLTSEKVDS